MVISVFFRNFALDFDNNGNQNDMNWGKSIYVLAGLLLALQIGFAQEELPVIDMSADRVTLYPQRMDLSGRETLFDMLQLFPNHFTEGYETWLTDYEIRIDNGPYGGDMRALLYEMKASRILKIQISDEPGVAKGLTGTKGCVDVFLLPLEEGAHGTVSAEVSSNLKVTPFSEFRYGSEKTDVLVNASYNYRHENVKLNNGDPIHQQYANFHMTNNISEKDQLVTYITQNNTNSFVKPEKVSLVTGDITSPYVRTNAFNFVGQLRNYHFFNPQTFLMSAVVYMNGTSPSITYHDDPQDLTYKKEEKLNVFAAVEELNTTFFDALNLMAGIEGDYVIDDNWSYNNSMKSFTNAHAGVFNADAYVELDYTYKQWRFTIGDRVRFYRYQVDKLYMGIETQHRCHNLAHASIVYTPHRQHQIQLAYARKYKGPEYMLMQFDETPFNEVKLAYTFSRPNVTASLNTYFDNQKAPSGTVSNWLRVDASAYYRIKFFTVTGGISSYTALGRNKIYNLAFRVNPVFNLPYGMRVQCRFDYYINYNIDAMGMFPYDEVQFTKTWGPWGKGGVTLDTYVQWHTDYNAKYFSVGTLGLRMNM